ncbi:uncharacterized mitochondrial protein AtMg00820-like [Salvia miltiorrhiza]|uniref:uncharacterized mitochondrial protein AtMg00820-like n=1 Tax=Salvia miltiorrhiza TaxID=226208 RepID=UPI0025ABC5B8|nr:uncharacterized mitochondrial protein AtMg00820-like [Salvia miltiorrhiza]
MLTRAKHGIFKPKSFAAQVFYVNVNSELNTTNLIVYEALTTDVSEKQSLPSLPLSTEEALQYPGWLEAMNKEITALGIKGTWILLPPDPSYKVISNKWVFRIKTLADGTLDQLKAHLVARGF